MRSKIKPALALVAAVLLVVPLNAFAGQQRARHGRRGKAASSASSQLHRTHARARHRRARASSHRARASSHRARASSHRHHARVKANLSLALALRVSPGRRSRAAHVAGEDPSDTISDFKFTPATITIHAGDTITWTNVGPTEHTATASNGSFNTGILKKGQSASHTFTQPGTYAYICTIHPFMHGTIVVLASSTTTTTTSTTPTTTTTPASTTSSTGSTTPGTTESSGSTLPMTGFDLDATWLAGVALIGAAILIRRKLRNRS
jgi:plastocyanin